jgi:hypothetical protein
MPRHSLDHAGGDKPLPFYVMADLLIRVRSAEKDVGCRRRKIAVGENVLALCAAVPANCRRQLRAIERMSCAISFTQERDFRAVAEWARGVERARVRERLWSRIGSHSDLASVQNSIVSQRDLKAMTQAREAAP